MRLELGELLRRKNAFGLLHTVASYLLYVLWVAHVGGALKHQFVDKDPELQRMMP